MNLSEGREETEGLIDRYLATARLIRQGIEEAGLYASGGEHSPYIWANTPEGLDDWEFFDRLLSGAGIIATPGSGFGTEGRKHFRLTAFNDLERSAEAMERLNRFVHGL